MNIAGRLARRVIHQAGFDLVPLHRNKDELPPGAEEFLRRDNPELRALSLEYERADRRVTTGFQWKNRTIRQHDLRFFRGDNAYVWQREPDASYVLTARHVASLDSQGLLDKLHEDGLFGARTVQVDGRTVSRDLLDSILEMYFLEKHSLRPDTILDIGAGYGRLAHRLTESQSSVHYACVDAIPASTFLSRYYLEFRRSRAQVIALQEFDSTTIDLTINIHSFTECTLEAVNWWLSRLRTRYLFVVPNAMDHGGTRILNSRGQDLLPVIDSHHFEMVAKEPKYSDPMVQLHGVQPTWYYLFASRRAPGGESAGAAI